MNFFSHIIVVLVLSVSSFAKAENSIVLSLGKVEFSAFQSMSKLVLIEAYSKIGKSVEFEKLPGARSLYAANNGDTDGELARVGGLEKKYPNLIQLSIPIAYDEIIAYSKNAKLKIEGWQSLKPHKIGHMSGFTRVAKRTEGMDTEKVTTEKQGLQKLNMGRTDVFVGMLGTSCHIHKLKLDEINALEQPLEKVIMYHYLNKRHSQMAKSLETVLQAMQKSGEMELIQTKSKQHFLNNCK